MRPVQRAGRALRRSATDAAAMPSGGAATAGPDLERRLRALEDRAEIAALIARYGPAVDSLEGGALGEIWAETGEYAFDDTVLRGAGVGALVDLPQHRELVANGCAHILTAPHVTVDGDRAVAVNHSVVLEHADTEEWRAVRVSANRWRLIRTPRGWRVESRRNRLLDGDAAAQSLLAGEWRPADAPA